MESLMWKTENGKLILYQTRYPNPKGKPRSDLISYGKLDVENGKRKADFIPNPLP